MQVLVQILCKCGQCKMWIEDGQITGPCPNCGRVYYGYYNKRKLTISAKEIRIPWYKSAFAFIRLFFAKIFKKN